MTDEECSPEDPNPDDANHPANAPEDLAYNCQVCNYLFRGDREVQYCSRCGTKLEQPQKERLVLLVDDSTLARKKIGAILKTLGCQVEEAENGLQGLAKAQATNPDLIILDVMMPKKDGLETLRELRGNERFKKTPIIMMTIKSDPATISEAIKGLASDYIRKDSKVSEIMTRLKKHLV